MQKRDNIVKEQIEKRQTEIEQEEDDNTTDVHVHDPFFHAYTEAQDAMAEFEDVLANEDDIDVD